MKRVSLDGGSTYVKRSYEMFRLVADQWQEALKNSSASLEKNQEAYYDARWILVEEIHSEMYTSRALIPLDVYFEMLRHVDMAHLQPSDIRYYLEPVDGNAYGQMRVHLFYGGDDRWDKQSRVMRANPIGKGHGHKIVIINADGTVVAVNEGRKSAKELELESEFAQ